MSGLPEGVQLVEPAPAAAQAAPAVAAPLNTPAPAVSPATTAGQASAVPQEQADLAEKLSAGLVAIAETVPMPPAVTEPAKPGGEPASAAETELEAAREHIAAIAASPTPLPAPATSEPASAAVVSQETPGEASAPAPALILPEPARPEPEAAPQPEPEPEPKPAPVSAPAASVTATEPAEGGAAQIKNAEHQIDDLLSVSLIHSDNSSAHHRLPEPVASAKSEDESGVDLELNENKRSASAGNGAKDDHPAVHHGLKVIQPLEPIVPPKERFAKELAEMNGQQAGGAPQPTPAAAAAAPSVSAGAPVAARTPAPVPVPAARVTVPVPPPSSVGLPVVPPAPKPPLKPQAEFKPPVAQPASAEVKPPAAPPVADSSFDDVLPQAESLEAGDVAKARAERQQAEALAPTPTPVAPTAEPKLPEQAAPAAIVKHAAPMLPGDASAEDKAGDEKGSDSKLKRKRGGRLPDKPEKAVEHVESEEEAQHNEPSAAAAEAAPLTGKLILPSGEKPAKEPELPKTEKPKKLAPGEVYVDDSGNVMIGE